MEENWRLQSDPTFAFVQSNGVSSSSQILDHLWLQNSSAFNGSMMSFEELQDKETRGISLFQSLIRASNGEDEGEDAVMQPEKKKRLTTKQVVCLERSFEADNKLEPDRKMELANELGLQPRQVAIWFQNRRARYKTKQLEKDYDALRSRYDSLKADHDTLLREKERLRNEVILLTDKLRRNSDESNSGKGESSHVADSEEEDDLHQSMFPSPYFPTIDSMSSEDHAFFWPY